MTDAGAVPAADAAATDAPHRSLGRRVLDLGAENSLLVVLVATLFTVVLGLAPLLLVGDSWMTLVAGREVVHHGIPQHDALASMTLGHRWLDQQWLAQVLFYVLAAGGGLRAAVLVHALLVTGAAAIAIVAARTRGATARSTLLVVTLALLVAPWSWTLRAQAVALPLFVAVTALLAADRNLLRGRTWLVLPLLVVWANVHGSVVVGAAIASWAGLIGLGELALRRPTSARPWRSAVLLVAPWLCVLATPYGLAIASYYRTMFLDSQVAQAVTEWQAPRPHGYQLVFFAAALLTVLIAIRGRKALSLFDLGVLLLTLAGSLRSARGIVWFALAAAILLPVALDAILPPDTSRLHRRVGLALCAGSLALVALAAVVWLPRGDGWYEDSWSQRGAQAVATALPGLPPGAAVYAGDHYSDWLLWKVPALRGRVAYDIRFELLTDAQWRAVRAFRSSRAGWQAEAARYPIVVLQASEGRRRIAAFTGIPRARVLYRDRDVVVVATPT